MGLTLPSMAACCTSLLCLNTVIICEIILTRIISDYATNELLDRYSDRDIDDDEDVEEMTAAQRRAADATMARRDRLERGGRGRRATTRATMPDFLQSDDADDDADGGLLSGMKKRTRRQYDERRDADDMEGVEDVSTIMARLRRWRSINIFRNCRMSN